MKQFATLLGAGLAALVLASPETRGQECVVKIGRVVPMTAPLLDMGRETPWLDENKVKPINDAGGLQVGDQKCMIE